MFFFRIFLRRYRSFTRSRRVAFVMLSVLIFAYATFGFYLFERQVDASVSLSDALWWAIVTMTTVGYGDITPRSELTRMLVGYPTILLGVVFVGYVLSDISTKLFEINRTRRRGLKKMQERNHLVIVRYVGEARIKSIVAELGKDRLHFYDNIVLIDDRVQEISNSLAVHFIYGDPALPETLRKANLPHASAVIVLRQPELSEADSDLKNIAAVLAIRALAPSVPVIVECADPAYQQLLDKAGSTHTVCLEGMREKIIVQELLDPGVLSIVHELTTNLSGNQLYLIKTPAQARTWQDVKKHYGNICLLGIRRGNANHLAPLETFPLVADDRIVCIAQERPAHGG